MSARTVLLWMILLVVGTNNNNNSNSSSPPPLLLFVNAQTTTSTASSKSIIRDVIFIFLCGIAIIVALVLGTYGITILIDRYRVWMGITGDPEGAAAAGQSQRHRNHHNLSSSRRRRRDNDIVGGRLVRHAGLYGLTKKQRMQLIEYLLPPIPYDPIHGGCHNTAVTADSATLATACASSDQKDIGDGDADVDVEHTTSKPFVTDDKTEMCSDTCETDLGNDTMRINQNNNGDDDDDDDSEQGDDDYDRMEMGSPTEKLSSEDVFDNLRSCSICLTAFEPGMMLLRAKHCQHVFRWDCCIEWLQSKDVCPYCRTPMFTAEELRTAAYEVLGTDVVEQMVRSKAIHDQQQQRAAGAARRRVVQQQQEHSRTAADRMDSNTTAASDMAVDNDTTA